MPFRVEKNGPGRPLLKLFNYYNYILNNTYRESEAELQKYPAHMQAWASIQKARVISTLLTQFKTTHMSILRQVRKSQGQAQHIDIDIDIDPVQNYVFQDLPLGYRQIMTDLYNEKEYDLLYDLMFNYSTILLDSLANLKQMDMTGEELLRFITLDADPYKWYNTINTLLWFTSKSPNHWHSSTLRLRSDTAV